MITYKAILNHPVIKFIDNLFYNISMFLIQKKVFLYKRFYLIKYIYLILIFFLLTSVSKYNTYHNTYIYKIGNYNKKVEELNKSNVEYTEINIYINKFKNTKELSIDAILNNFYFGKINELYSNFLNYLNNQMDVLGIKYILKLPSYVSKKEYSTLFSDFLINDKYKSGIYYIPLDLSYKLIGRNQFNIISNSVLSITQLRNLLMSFVFVLSIFEYDNSSRTVHIVFSIYGLK